MKPTEDVVTDLWPLYRDGEASPDTRTLVENFLEQNPDFARRLRDDTSDRMLKPLAMALPADHERETLLRTQRRRAFQSMSISGLVLLATIVMTTIYLWRVVPRWVTMFAGVGLALPASTRLILIVSDWALSLVVPAVVILSLIYFFRKRIHIPDVVRSGTALALLTGLALLVTQMGWLALMMESFSVVGDAYNIAGPATRVNRAMIAMRSGNYGAAVEHLQLSERRLRESDAPDVRLAISTSMLLADAYAKLGETGRAREYYQQALRQARSVQDAGRDLQDLVPLEQSIREALETIGPQ